MMVPVENVTCTCLIFEKRQRELFFCYRPSLNNPEIADISFQVRAFSFPLRDKAVKFAKANKIPSPTF